MKPTNRSTPHRFIADSDISEMQIYITLHTYDRFAREYADKWEWDTTTITEIKKYNIEPFSHYCIKGGDVLLAGCRAGRDYKLLTEAGYRCIGVEPSYGLLVEAMARNKGGLFLQTGLRGLPFMPASFGGVYANALTHVPKRDLLDTLRDFRIFLKPKGVLYLALKIGGRGVLVVNDLGGERYHTLYTKREVDKVVNLLGMKILWSEKSGHTDTSLPGWYSLVAQKP